MYAIFRSGGRQYEARPGQTVRVDKIAGDIGDTVTLDEVLVYFNGDKLEIGRPLLEGVQVQAKIIERGLMSKIVIFKHKRRKDYRKKQGHRQNFTAVRIESIG